MQQTQFQFPPNILKNLSDKSQQKRQVACRDLEIVVSKNADKKHLVQIQKIIAFFRDKYLRSYDTGKKVSGLEVMPSLINGMKGCNEGLNRLAPLVVAATLECLNQTEHKVRMTALKSLYYITKTLDERIVPMFNSIFQKLIGKINDLDQVVKSAAVFFDKSLQTILTSALNTQEGRKCFDLNGFMQIVKAKIKSMNPGIRQFLIRWIVTLNEMVAVDLLGYLPDLLQDLLFMLGDKQKSLRSSAQQCLLNFKKDMKDKFEQGKLIYFLPEPTLAKVLSTLIYVTQKKNPSYSKNYALDWFRLLFDLFKKEIQNKSQSKLLRKVILDRFDQVLEVILRLMADQDQQVRKTAILANDGLMFNIQQLQQGNGKESVNFSKVTPLLKDLLSDRKSGPSSESALRWMKFMFESQGYSNTNETFVKEFIQKLVQQLCDSPLKNVNSIIQNTAVRQGYFQVLIQKMLMFLLQRVTTDPEHDREQILRKFSTIQESDKFCKSVCIQLSKPVYERKFVFQIVHHLNVLILNQKHMYRLRKKLQNPEDPEYYDTYHILFSAFKYNPAAVISITLLAKQYQIAYQFICMFSTQVEITQKYLMGFCKLASLIQSPGFLILRLHLLQRSDYFLPQALGALLMILPQGKLFNMLKNRLQIAKLSYIGEQRQKIGKIMQKKLNEVVLLKQFRQTIQNSQKHLQ